MKVKMSRRLRLGIASASVLSAVFIGWLIGSGGISGEYDELLVDREKYTQALKAVRAQREARPELDERESNFVARTLGATIESVDSRIRRRLYALGSTAGPGTQPRSSPVGGGNLGRRGRHPANRPRPEPGGAR